MSPGDSDDTSGVVDELRNIIFRAGIEVLDKAYRKYPFLMPLSTPKKYELPHGGGHEYECKNGEKRHHNLFPEPDEASVLTLASSMCRGYARTGIGRWAFLHKFNFVGIKHVMMDIFELSEADLRVLDRYFEQLLNFRHTDSHKGHLVGSTARMTLEKVEAPLPPLRKALKLLGLRDKFSGAIAKVEVRIEALKAGGALAGRDEELAAAHKKEEQAPEKASGKDAMTNAARLELFIKGMGEKTFRELLQARGMKKEEEPSVGEKRRFELVCSPSPCDCMVNI